MILTLNSRYIISCLFAIFFGALAFLPDVSLANQTLTITPTLFDAKVVPGQVWTSAIKVVNPNEYPITVYAEVLNFYTDDETGRPSFIPILATEANGSTLAEWVSLNQSGIVIPKGQSVNIPFVVTVPSDAPPGGHYAAITIGTKPPANTLTDSSQVTTAQVVTSLLFLKVDGNIIEKATIREFRAETNIAQKAENSFSLRVQNEGNVHIQPQGEITIFNMWGAKRGSIPINQQTQYGAVLKESIREFNFSWNSDTHLFDIGRYKAVVTLGYGDEQKQFITSTTYFWVIPYTAIIVTLSVLFGFAYFVSFAIRLYIRRVLLLSGIDPRTLRVNSRVSPRKGDLVLQVKPSSTNHEIDVDSSPSKRFSLSALWIPIKQMLLDFRQATSSSPDKRHMLFAIWHVVRQYRYLFLTALVIFVMIGFVVWFRSIIYNPVANYTVTLDNGTSNETFSAEELFYNNLPEYIVSDTTEFPEQLSTIVLVNTSGSIGAAATQKRIFDAYGIIVSELTADFTRTNARTIIVYDRSVIDEAVAYSKFLNNALLSLREGVDEGLITIYIGKEYAVTQ